MPMEGSRGQMMVAGWESIQLPRFPVWPFSPRPRHLSKPPEHMGTGWTPETDLSWSNALKRGEEGEL